MNDKKNDKPSGIKPDDKHLTAEKGHGNPVAGQPKVGSQGDQNVKDSKDQKAHVDPKGHIDPKGQKDQLDPKAQKDEKRTDRR